MSSSSTMLCHSVSESSARKQDELRSSMSTNKAASRWRPSYHLIATHGWMNDPCAPGFSPSTGTYHVGFQWNANGAEWGDIVWGNAFSKDLVSWDVSQAPILESDAPYDRAAVFTGCWVPTGVYGRHGEGAAAAATAGEVTVAYTSVSRLPIHYTREYHRGCETLSMATSTDGGKTWTKLDNNPVLPGPQEGQDATGWRDPYVARWPAMRTLLARRPGGGGTAGKDEEGGDLFGIISGGIRHKTPTTWLYRIDPGDLTKWQYVAPLVMPGASFSPSRWTGDLGLNWEVTNFVSVEDKDRQHSQDFLIFGAEGCKAPYGGAGVVPGTKRCNRAQLWIAIDEASDSNDAALTKLTYGGIFDHGLYYAANGFWDPVSKQQIVIGWVTEDDLPVEMQVAQGWSGCLSLPRVVTLATIQHVCRASATPLGDLTCMKALPDKGHAGLYTMQTLSIMPDPRLQKLRLGAAKREISDRPLLGRGRQAPPLVPLQTACWEAHCVFSGVGACCKRIGLRIHHLSATVEENATTVLYFSPRDETFVIERPDLCRLTAEDGTGLSSSSSSSSSIELQDEKAPFTLFTLRNPETGADAEERLKIQLFYDESVLEVFVNDRAVITTRLYLEETQCSGLEIFAEPLGDECAVLEEAIVWDGLSQ